MPWWAEILVAGGAAALGGLIGFKLRGKAPPDGRGLRRP